MRIRRTAAFVALATLTIVPLTAPPAAADFSCALDEATGTLTVSTDQEAPVRRSGDLILVKGRPCDAATVFNTDLIRFATGKPIKTQHVDVDLGGGPFTPGLTDEGDGSSEIEFEADLGLGGDVLRVLGTSAADHFVQGDLGTNLNPEEAIDDIDLTGVDAMYGLGGDDLLSANGGSGTGTETGLDSFFSGDGDDTIIAAGGGETLNLYDGGIGHDLVDFSAKLCSIDTSASFGDTLILEATCSGDPGGDLGRGIEELIGTRFDDELEGLEVGEVFRSKGGDDTLLGKGGNDVLNGGKGTDLCTGGDGDDIRIRCEGHVGQSRSVT